MRLLSAFCLALIFVASFSRLDAQQVPSGPDPKTVSVLYATNSRGDLKGQDYEVDKDNEAAIKQTVAFLETHFSKVGIYDRSREEFSYDLEKDISDDLEKEPNALEKAAVGYDVVIVDWKSIMPEDREEPPEFKLYGSEFGLDLNERYMEYEREKYPFPQRFSKPMVIMGGSIIAMTPEEGSEILADELQWMPWKPSFTGNYAYSTDTNHSIFKEPLNVPIEWETIDNPVSFYLFPGTQDVNETLRAWKVQDAPIPRPRGVSCSRRYFDKTKDAEVITCGTAEAPDSVMIGRHGNRLVWGYSSDPNQMTAAGQAAFVNAVCYMTNFGGRLPGGVAKPQNHRREFLESIYLMRAATNIYATANEEDMRRLFPPTPGKRPNPEPAYYAKVFQKSGQEYVEKLMKTLPRDISDPFVGDVEELVVYYTDNYEYLYLDPRHRYVVDEEAKSLGLNIRSSDFLSRCIELLGTSKDTESALVLLRRYAGKIAETPEQWRAWYESEGKNWVFDEYTTKFRSREQSDE